MNCADPTATPSGHPIGVAVGYTTCALIGLHYAITGTDVLFQVTAAVYAAQCAVGVALLHGLSPRQEQS